jgi:N-ethylmaleimide reductase
MKLLEPCKLGSRRLPNRMVMAPLTRRRAETGKIPGEMMALYYEQRAGAGLIVTESTEVDPRSGGVSPTRPGLFNRAQMEGWRRVVQHVHGADGQIWVQLSHLGRASHPLMLQDGAEPVGPSPIAATGNAFTPAGPQPFPVPRALQTDDIAEIVGQFADSADLALQAGFDGIEIHAANGYLIDQFLRSGANRRTDAYGGSPANRARFLTEVTEAVIEVAGPDRVGVRLSPWNGFNGMADDDPAATFGHAADLLDQLGIAYLHIIGADEATPATEQFLSEIRRRFGGALILAQGYDAASAERALQAGAADMIAFGKAYLANPDLPERIRSGGNLNTPDPSTFYAGGARGYIDYPSLAGVRPSYSKGAEHG